MVSYRGMEKEEERKFQRGLDQFNARAFFEAHETWEEIWLPALEPEKAFLQGIIQIAAGFYHYTRGNRAGTQSLLEAGLGKLERFPTDYRGLKLEELRAIVRWWIAKLAAGQDPGPAHLPPIEPINQG